MKFTFNKFLAIVIFVLPFTWRMVEPRSMIVGFLLIALAKLLRTKPSFSPGVSTESQSRYARKRKHKAEDNKRRHTVKE